jgi:hypothetical protein
LNEERSVPIGDTRVLMICDNVRLGVRRGPDSVGLVSRQPEYKPER